MAKAAAGHAAGAALKPHKSGHCTSAANGGNVHNDQMQGSNKVAGWKPATSNSIESAGQAYLPQPFASFFNQRTGVFAERRT